MAEALMTYGVPGPQGIQGPTGATGPRGPTGPAGSAGSISIQTQTWTLSGTTFSMGFTPKLIIFVRAAYNAQGSGQILLPGWGISIFDTSSQSHHVSWSGGSTLSLSMSGSSITIQTACLM